MRQFSELVATTVGVDRIGVFIYQQGQGFMRANEGMHSIDTPLIEPGDPLIRELTVSKVPIVRDVLQRVRPNFTLEAVSLRMAELKVAIAVGIYSSNRLEGLLLLGPRLSGRIYGEAEQSTLQIVCNHFAVALENAGLYTQLKDSASYNDTLLDNLVSGVIAANMDRVITVCNREAGRILGLEPQALQGKMISELPLPLGSSLEKAFESGRETRDRETVLKRSEASEEIYITYASALFRGHKGDSLGALLVFNDLTAIKKLEKQVRRTDRLASRGTLAAGMAHEIKNPLVTLKTFTQLLPERYEDEDFRETFSSLVGQEVKRIDSIVNQLLHFARPAKPSLQPTGVHQIVENTLRLVRQQLRQRNIELISSLEAARDMIQGDHDLLVQALLNFLLNAIDAMPDGGILTIETSVLDRAIPDIMGEIPTKVRSRRTFRLSIRDSGSGISREDLQHVFDPFFTTKTSGTGLGLSVSHGIIHEHGGAVDVDSQLGRGTVFHLMFPVLEEEVPA